MTTVERVNMRQAAAMLRVSHAKMWKLVKDGVIAAETNPLDRRQKLVLVADVEKLQSAERTTHRPKPSTVGAVDLDVQSDEIEEWLEANWHP